MTATYQWPDPDDLACQVVGADGPLIAVGLLPHANEPLGSAFATTARGYSGDLARIALIGPIDPPPRPHRFPLPCEPVTFAAQGYLQRLQDQVEFAHGPDPETPAQRRAAEFRVCLRKLAPDALLLVHNDPGATAPYLYANAPWPTVEYRLRGELAADYPPWQPLDVDWTHQLSERTYAFFPGECIGVAGTESAGVYLERELGIPTLTVELPMFRWDRAERVRQDYIDALSEWVADGAADGGDRDGLIREATRLLTGYQVRMVPPAVSSRVVWAVLEGVREGLVQARGRARARRSPHRGPAPIAVSGRR